jgi:hypothetical protein
VVLERAYGGVLLAELLLGGSVTGLGSDVSGIGRVAAENESLYDLRTIFT